MAKAKTVVSVKSYDELVDAIREASTLEELKRLVVPPADELEASRRRIAQLDELAPLCNFDAVYVDDETHQARDRYKRIGCAFPSI